MKARIKGNTIAIPKTPINCMLLIEVIEEIQNGLPQFKLTTDTDQNDIMHCRLYIDGTPATTAIMQRVADYTNLNQ